MSVNDTREIRHLGTSPQSHALRTPAKSPKVVVGGACVVQTSGYPFERRSDSLEDLKSQRYARLGLSARNAQYGNVDLAFASGRKLAGTKRVASIFPPHIFNKRRLLLDLFGGSGSTLIACEKTQRRCFMMEIDPHYIDVIIARWEKYTGKKAQLLNNLKAAPDVKVTLTRQGQATPSVAQG